MNTPDVRVWARVYATQADPGSEHWNVYVDDNEDIIALLTYSGEGAERRAKEHANLLNTIVNAPVE